MNSSGRHRGTGRHDEFPPNNGCEFPPCNIGFPLKAEPPLRIRIFRLVENLKKFCDLPHSLLFISVAPDRPAVAAHFSSAERIVKSIHSSRRKHMIPVESGKLSLPTTQQCEIITSRVNFTRALAVIDHSSHTPQGGESHRFAVAETIRNQPLIDPDKLDHFKGSSPSARLDLSPKEAAGVVAEVYVNFRNYSVSQETAMIRSFNNCVMQSPVEVAKQLTLLQRRIGLHSQSSHVLKYNFLTQTPTTANTGGSGLLTQGLADLALPVVSGFAAGLRRIAGAAFDRLKLASIQETLTLNVSEHFLRGSCACEDHADRMGRAEAAKCHPSHSIHNWDPLTQPLLNVLFTAITGVPVRNAFRLPAVPSGLRAFSIKTCRNRTNAFRYGMALWQIGEHLEQYEVQPIVDEPCDDEDTLARPRARRRRKRGQSMDSDAAPRKRFLVSLREARVHPVLICSRPGCKQLVGPDNACACTRTGTHKWPLAKKPTLRIFADEADAKFWLRDVFRVQPEQEGEGCLHFEKDAEHSLKDSEAPLLFPVDGRRTCPACGKNMTGRATEVYVPGLHSDTRAIERVSPEFADDTGIPDGVPVCKLVQQFKAQCPRPRRKKIQQLIDKYEALCKSEPTRTLSQMEILQLLWQTKKWVTFPCIEAAVRHLNQIDS